MPSHFRARQAFCFAVLAWLVASFGGVRTAGADEVSIDFERQIAPLLIKRCVECHGSTEPSGSLRLTSASGLQSGGESGPAVDRENPEESHLLQRVLDGDMPPPSKGQSQKLPQDEIDLLRTWLVNGATWPADRELDLFERTSDVRGGLDWWSLQPIVKPPLPAIDENRRPVHPIDAFLLDKLQAAGMTQAPRAAKHVLVRRLYHDLLGLPPTKQQVDAFVDNRSPTAWEDLIDELLAMPQYGERWARYWLDLARYADTSGYERDQEKAYAWKYRDWVVDAFNQDMPFDRFLTEQLAGDEIDDRTERSVIATGFLRLGTWNDEPNDPLDYQYDRLEDLVHTTSSVFLGMTVKCARCHPHKFDPIPQEDYYRLASVFWPGPIAARDRDLLGGPTAEELGFAKVLGWTDLTSQPSPIHLLSNGDRTRPLHEVVPASLSFLPSLQRDFEPADDSDATSKRRLQLARWMTDPNHPLTPRVIVNRIWQHHFGQGVVRTPSNFGFLGDPPTHPQLLDWLAAEFLESGQSIKAMHRLILTSESWRQASLHPKHEEYQRRDPLNRLWWRAERRRLDAESLRDSILAASGELDLRVGGESFKADVSAEALEGLSRKSAAWQASPPQEQKRRSLYMYMKRGLLPPFMTAFDLCDATQSVGQRDVTTVPTQALSFLNNEFVHQQSTALAEGIVEAGVDRESQVRRAWHAILKRSPSDQELADATRHLEVQGDWFARHRELPQSSDESVRQSATSKHFDSLRFHLRADQAVADPVTNRVRLIPDASGHGHSAVQDNPPCQPTLVPKGWNGAPVLEFDGDGKFMEITGQLLRDPNCTIVCVVSDQHGQGHREVISNWNSVGNIGTSIFLGLTDDDRVRFTDAFADAGQVVDRDQPFILSAVHDTDRCEVFQSGRRIAALTHSLPSRNVDAPWVIGQQGNIGGEFWRGRIAEVRVYDRALSGEEQRQVESELADRYGLQLDRSVRQPEPTRSPEVLALASLCHVLMNCNEFIYLD